MVMSVKTVLQEKLVISAGKILVIARFVHSGPFYPGVARHEFEPTRDNYEANIMIRKAILLD